MNEILNDFDIDKITFKKPEKISDKITVFEVKYNKIQNFIIQTPKWLIPNVPIIYSHNHFKFYKLKVVAYNMLFQKTTKQFVNKIENIDEYVKTKIPYFLEKIKKKRNIKFINTTTYYNNKANFYFNIQFYNKKPVLGIYDWRKEKKNLNYLIEDSLAYSLIWLKNVWIKSNKIGLNWVILQMKVYLPIYKIDECLIKDEEEIENEYENYPVKSNSITYKDHELYSKYFKMKRLRIPIPSIQQKMTLDQLNPLIILKNEDDIAPVNTNIKPSVSHLAGLKNVTLNKTEKTNKIHRKKIQGNQSSSRPPTLEEILNTRNKLKKIDR